MNALFCIVKTVFIVIVHCGTLVYMFECSIEKSKKVFYVSGHVFNPPPPLNIVSFCKNSRKILYA